MDTIIRNRSSSLGRSSLIEKSINIFQNFYSTDFDLEEFSSIIINNELPGEFRSILWRVYLGILPTPFTNKELISHTKSYRKEFDSVITEKLFQNTLNFYNNKLIDKKDSLQSVEMINFKNDFEHDFAFIKQEIDNYSKDYDLFKSEILKESFLTIYLAWRVKNDVKLHENSIVSVSRILAIIIYSLYPCILHLNNSDCLNDEIDDNEENLKTIFYYLNFEDYHDHDIFKIFETILQMAGLKNYIIDFSDGTLKNQLNEEISKVENTQESNLDEMFERKLNLDSKEHLFSNNIIENISFNFLFFINKDLLKKLCMKDFNVYNYTGSYYLSFLYNATKFENVSYLADNILMHSKKEELRFLGYLIISILINLEDDYVDLSKEELRHFFDNFPLIRSDPKDYIGKALKIREKINKKFYNN